jgi:hypothetical protein
MMLGKRISFYSLIFQQVHVSLTHVVTVVLPQHVSMQFAPPSAGFSHLYF